MTIEDLLIRNKINIKKTENSFKIIDYYTQNFFDNNTVVPTIQVGEVSRKLTENVREEQLSDNAYKLTSNIGIIYPSFNIYGESSRDQKNVSNEKQNEYYFGSKC